MNSQQMLKEKAKTLQAMLFVSSEPIDARQLCEAGELDLANWDALEQALKELLKNSGLMLEKVAGGYRLVTARDQADAVERILQVTQKKRLTRAQLETLAVVAYHQPITRAVLEEKRGVNSDRALSQLVAMELVEEKERAPLPGRPILFATGPKFLYHFSLESLDELPEVVIDSNLCRQGAQELVEYDSDEGWSKPNLRETAMGELLKEVDKEPSPRLQKLLNKISERQLESVEPYVEA